MINWLEDIKEEDLPPQYQEMSKIIGMEGTLRLAEHFGKMGVYFVSLEPLIREKKRQFIIKNFDGGNHRQLARATGFSLVYIYELLREAKKIDRIKQKLLFEME